MEEEKVTTVGKVKARTEVEETQEPLKVESDKEDDDEEDDDEVGPDEYQLRLRWKRAADYGCAGTSLKLLPAI